MSRRHKAEKREVIPDAKYGDVILAKFMNSIMYDGKKSAAEAIVYGAFDLIEQKAKAEPLPLFKQALENVAPAIEVRSRRVGGATYQVPVEVRAERRQPRQSGVDLSLLREECRNGLAVVLCALHEREPIFFATLACPAR